ncbi:MAG: adenosylcobalamin-dependent ribonucleoside-diphosphate reductase [Anaerolineae bacterium]
MSESLLPAPTASAPREIQLTPNARVVLSKRYLRRGPDGQPIEAVEGMFERISRAVAEPDTAHGDFDETELKFFDLLTTLRFFPNSPTFTGAGTPLGQLAACFVLPIQDDMGREADGIFQTLRNAALIQQTGGGNGFSFSRLRPKGDFVATSAGTATGPVGFLRVYDKAFGEVAQGGSRRGANMAVLRVDHPDIMEFIRCKAQEGQISNFNISVALTDDFMRAVKDDAEFDLLNPRDHSVWKRVRAREVFDEIVKYAHHNGEPGCLFIDTANAANPVPHLYALESTNPCGEQWLGPYENCCLGSINLAQHITVVNGKREVDWAKLQRTTEEATHFLDNVVSANKYVPSVPELRRAALRARRIGLGIMGLGDMMYALGVRYGSRAGEEFAGQIMEFVRFHCMRTSVKLAEERGPFESIRGSIYDPDDLKWQPPTPLSPYTHDWGRPAVNWTGIVTGIRQHGIRNAAQTTIAPTGTIATVAGCEGYGCEPVFALAYTRHVKDPNGGPDIDLTYASPLFEQALTEVGLDEVARQKIYDKVMRTGTCQDIAEVPAAIRDTFAVAGDIAPEEHVRMQAAMQAFVDNSLSKTCNFPEGAAEADVAKAFMMAWELGCKGLTVYVTGSREQVVLETKQTQEAKQQAKLPVVVPKPRERQSVLTGKTYRMETPIGTAYVTINECDGEPYEVFINVGKGGSDVAAVSEALGRLCSLELQTPSPLSARDRAKEIVHKLRGISGSQAIGFGPQRVASLPDAIAVALSRYIEADQEQAMQLPLTAAATAEAVMPTNGNGKSAHRDLCPECGQATLMHEEGCRHCISCGFSKC